MRDVELGEGVAALGPQRLGLIQDRRNPPLLRQRWEGDVNGADVVEVKASLHPLTIQSTYLNLPSG